MTPQNWLFAFVLSVLGLAAWGIARNAITLDEWNDDIDEEEWW